MRALIARDLADAAVARLSADRRFATSYNAALQAANMAIACAGYRITAKIGHQKLSLESAALALGKSAESLTDYFETCRRKTTIHCPLEVSMSLTKKRTLTEKRLAANQANGRRARGPSTAEGRQWRREFPTTFGVSKKSRRSCPSRHSAHADRTKRRLQTEFLCYEASLNQVKSFRHTPRRRPPWQWRSGKTEALPYRNSCTILFVLA